MGFFDVVGDIINPRNILTAGGFALGGPPGAAAGRAVGGGIFGDNWDPTDDGSLGERLGGVPGDALTGAAMGFGGQALGASGGNWLGMGASKAATPTTAGALAGGSPAGPLAAGGGLPAGSLATPTSFAGGGSAGLGPLAGVAGGASSSPVVTAGAPAAAVPEASGGGGGFLSDIGGWFGQMEPFEQAYIGLQGLGAVGNTVSAISDASLAKRRRERMERLARLLSGQLGQNLQATQQSFNAPPIFDQNRGY